MLNNFTDCELLNDFLTISTNAAEVMEWESVMNSSTWCCEPELTEYFTCVNNSIVVFDLNSQGIIGNLQHLGGLNSLSALNLGNNELTGSLEPLGAFPELDSLILQRNEFTGSLDTLSRFPSLTDLWVSQNRFSGSLQALSVMEQLRRASLNNNNLNGDLEPLQALTQLIILELHFNTLTGSLNSLQDLTELTWLALQSNMFHGSLEPLHAHLQLTALGVNDNQLTGSIDHLAELTQLRNLGLDNNFFSGPAQPLQTLSQLVFLSIRNNAFTGSVEFMQNLTQISSCLLSINEFTGSLQPLRNLTELTILDLSENDFTGSLEWVRNLTVLTRLVVFSNHLTGHLEHVRYLTQLTRLNIANNHITGSLDHLQNLTGLTILEVGVNDLTGSLAVLQDMSLVILNAFQNQLTGSLDVLTTSPDLDYLNLQDNRLTGNLEALRHLTQLTRLDLGHNFITGDLEPLLGFTNIYHIHLTSNRLSGSLETLKFIDDLDVLLLSENDFTGTLEPLRDHIRLRVFSAASNRLTGSLQPLTNFNLLETLDVSNNRLTGSLDALQDAHDLTLMRLSDNLFSSGLTAALSVNHAELTSVNVSSNLFTEDLEELLQLEALPAKLTGLDMGHNPFPLSTLPAFIPVGLERVFVLGVSSVQFQCPYPLLGSNVLIERDPCLHDWGSILALAGVGLLMSGVALGLYRVCCYPPSARLKRVIWWASWLNTILQLVLFIQFAFQMLADVARDDVNCESINHRDVFGAFLHQVVWRPPLGPYDSFVQYVEAVRGHPSGQAAEKALLPFQIELFTELCNRFQVCTYQSDAYRCDQDTSLGNPHLVFSNLLVAMLVLTFVKEALRIAFVLAIIRTGRLEYQCWGLTPDFIGRSFIVPLLLTSSHSRAYLDATLIQRDTTPEECIQQLTVEGWLGFFPELGLSVWYAMVVLQTGLLIQKPEEVLVGIWQAFDPWTNTPKDNYDEGLLSILATIGFTGYMCGKWWFKTRLQRRSEQNRSKTSGQHSNLNDMLLSGSPYQDISCDEVHTQEKASTRPGYNSSQNLPKRLTSYFEISDASAI